MTCMIDLPQRAGLARQLLLAGAALLACIGSALAETPAKPEKITRILTVTDSVQLVGSKISGGWREYAADDSWRRVTFVLDGNVATVTFGDGMPGRRVPSVTRYGYAGPGPKGSPPATYGEVRTFAGATPDILGKANRSSPIPDKVATRIREFGGDIKLMQQLADIKRISELGSALDAARGPADDGGVFGDRPGGSPRRSGGGWKDPRGGVGRDGRASESPSSSPEPIDELPETTDADGNRSSTHVTRHADGSTTTTMTWSDADGNIGVSRTEKDAHGNVNGGSGSMTRSNGDIQTSGWARNTKTGEVQYVVETTSPTGVVTHSRGSHHGTPSETPYSGRGGFNEAWMDKSLPWFMDAVYAQWKRESDQIQSGGKISQPGRGEEPSPIDSEGPEVGTSATVNCGDSSTNPCARFGGTEVDTRGGFGRISQPGLGEAGAGVPPPNVPPPIPNPQQK